MNSQNGVTGLAGAEASSVISKSLKETSQKRGAGNEGKRPLTLLELPVDILQLIAKEACESCTTMASWTAC
jgi:hypothetical protein